MLSSRLTMQQDRLHQRLTQARAHSMGRRDTAFVDSEVTEVSRRIRWVAFVECELFNWIIATSLLLNMWALALESDFPDWPWWGSINGLFLMVYTLEFCTRLLYRGPRQLLWLGKSRRWMAYDLLIIGIGLLDIAVSSLQPAPSTLSEGFSEGMAEVQALSKRRLFVAPVSTGQFGIMRFLMLCRLLRIVRILRMVSPLYDCVNLLMDMMSTFIWILSLIFLFCFVLAIILTRLLGHGLAVKTQDEELKAKVHSIFSDIPTSLFTLFQLTTAEDWSFIAGPVVQTGWLWRYFFVAFITFMSWTMLSLLTAVASETMIAFSSHKKEEEKIYQEIQRHNFTTFLCAEFLRADRDGNHVLDKDEFTTLMSRPSMMEEMRSHGIHLQDQDLARHWDTFDIDDSGELSIDELVTGFAYLQESLAMKHVANVGYSLKRFSVRMDTDIAQMEGDVERLEQDSQPLVERAIDRSNRAKDRWNKFWLDADDRRADNATTTPAKDRKTGNGVSSTPSSQGGGGRKLLMSWTRSTNTGVSRTTTI